METTAPTAVQRWMVMGMARGLADGLLRLCNGTWKDLDGDAVDIEEVVRCEDCKYRVLDTVNGEDWCNHTLGLCGEVYATDFCCHGERKDNG